MSAAAHRPSEPRPRNVTDLVLGGVLVALGLTVVLAAAQLKAGSTTDPLGPRGFPLLLGVGFIGAGVGLLVKTTLMSRRPADGLKAVLAAEDEEDDGPADLRRLVLSAVAVLAYVLLLPYVGFLLATAAFLATLIKVQGGTRLRPFVVMVVGFPFAVWLLFAVLLNVPLPSGVFDPLLLTDRR